MKKAALPFKVFLSLWVVYNIFTMMVMPNVGAYLGRSSAKFITPYANTVGLNATWNFFSPDPAHTMYIQYLVHFDDPFGVELKEPFQGFFPAEKNQAVREVSRKRDIYAMRFMIIEPKRLRMLFGPWLCRQHPGASSVTMEHIIETVPPLDQVLVLKEDSVRDLSQELKYIREEYFCNRIADEEAL